MSKPKVGDKYAIFDGSVIIGPCYVTSVRGSKVSLGPKKEEDPKALLTWRVVGDCLHPDQSFSSRIARPWTRQVGALAAKRQAMYELEGMIRTILRHPDIIDASSLRRALSILSTGMRTTKLKESAKVKR